MSPKKVRWETGKADASAHDWSCCDDIDGVTSSATAQGDLTVDEVPPTADPSIFTVNEDSWEEKTILSFDGGGVRGLTSILLLQELMKEVGMMELAADPKAVSSSYSPWVDSRVDDEKQLGYKPCHYFDYIGGTSTGGLIAIMLGRLRMTIEATIVEYQKLSAQVFERPSSRLKGSLSARRSATRGESLSKIFGSLIPEQPSPDEAREEFRSDPIRCKTIVCSIKSSPKNGFKEPFLFRSYDHERKSGSPYERNPGSASNFDIQSVARATSGAPFYTNAVQVRKSWYYDGAIDLNNPSWEVFNEVNLVNQDTGNSIHLHLSIGGGNCKSNNSKGIFSDKSLQRHLNDISQHIDKRLSIESERQKFSYYRLDVDEGLQNISLNEWKPKKTGETTLKRVVGALRNCIQTEKVRTKIHDCAQELVRIRRLRAQTMRWETFATGVRYYCRIPNCNYPKKIFETRNDLLDHLQIEHGKPPPDVEHYQEIQGLLDAGRSHSA